MKTATTEAVRPPPKTTITWIGGFRQVRVAIHLPVNNVVVEVEKRSIVLYAQAAGGWLGLIDTEHGDIELEGTDIRDLVRRAFLLLGMAPPPGALSFVAEDRYVLGC